MSGLDDEQYSSIPMEEKPFNQQRDEDDALYAVDGGLDGWLTLAGAYVGFSSSFSILLTQYK